MVQPTAKVALCVSTAVQDLLPTVLLSRHPQKPSRESHTEVGGLVEPSKVHNLYFVMFLKVAPSVFKSVALGHV